MVCLSITRCGHEPAAPSLRGHLFPTGESAAGLGLGWSWLLLPQLQNDLLNAHPPCESSVLLTLKTTILLFFFFHYRLTKSEACNMVPV